MKPIKRGGTNDIWGTVAFAKNCFLGVDGAHLLLLNIMYSNSEIQRSELRKTDYQWSAFARSDCKNMRAF